LVLDIKGTCDKYCRETLVVPTKEILALPIDLHLICTEYGLETRLAPNEKNYELALELPMYAEYGLETLPATSDEIRV